MEIVQNISVFIIMIMLTNSIKSADGFPTGTPIIARDPQDHHIYLPHVQYAGDLIRNNIIDYSNIFPDYDYKTGYPQQNSKNQRFNNNPNQQQRFDQNSNNQFIPNQQRFEQNSNNQFIPNQQQRYGQNSNNQYSPNQDIDRNDYNQDLQNQDQYDQETNSNSRNYNSNNGNNQQVLNRQTSFLEMLPIIGGFFSQQPTQPQRTFCGHHNQIIKNGINKIHLNPQHYQTVPLNDIMTSPKTNVVPNNQNILQALASNPQFLAQFQSFLEAQKLAGGQKVGGVQPGNVMTPTTSQESLINTPVQSQSISPETQVPKTENPNVLPQMLTTPKPSISSTPVPEIKPLSVPNGSPAESHLPTALPAGNVNLPSSLPAPSPVPAPPLASPTSDGKITQ